MTTSDVLLHYRMCQNCLSMKDCFCCQEHSKVTGNTSTVWFNIKVNSEGKTSKPMRMFNILLLNHNVGQKSRESLFTPSAVSVSSSFRGGRATKCFPVGGIHIKTVRQILSQMRAESKKLTPLGLWPTSLALSLLPHVPCLTFFSRAAVDAFRVT